MVRVYEVVDPSSHNTNPSAQFEGSVVPWNPEAVLESQIRLRVDNYTSVGGSETTQETGYVLGTNPAEQRRLQDQSRVWAEDSAWLLDRTGIAPGCRAVDVGCGPRGVLDLMAARVGPDGSVVGLEQNPAHAQLAEQFCRDNGLDNVMIVNGDAAGTTLPRACFDLVHERAVLVNVPNPESILAAMIDLARPGGAVACDDMDQSTRLCDPPHPAWDVLNDLILEVWRHNGSDPFFGRRLPGMMRRAGLEHLEVRLLAPEFWDLDHPRRFQLLTFVDNLRESMLATRTISEREIDRLMGELRNHLEDPRTMAISGLRYQVWGFRPA